MTNHSIECAKSSIREVVAQSSVPEDFRHADNTLEWLLRLDPKADEMLQVAALGHDIDRAVEARKVQRASFTDYDEFKAAHACNSALILREIMEECGVPYDVSAEAYRLVRCHEVGGDRRANLLKDADSISYFDVNLPLYYERSGYEETLRRSIWGYRRLSCGMKKVAEGIGYDNKELDSLLRDAMRAVNTPARNR